MKPPNYGNVGSIDGTPVSIKHLGAKLSWDELVEQRKDFGDDEFISWCRAYRDTCECFSYGHWPGRSGSSGFAAVREGQVVDAKVLYFS